MTNNFDVEKTAPTNRRQAFTVLFCVAVLGTLLWFWSEQIAEVMEMLELAYGDGS
jgi:hypothetical protein